MSTDTNQAFRKWRLRCNFSQVEAAKRLGISECCVCMYDNGRRYSPPKPVTVPLSIRLAAAAIEFDIPPIDNQRKR